MKKLFILILFIITCSVHSQSRIEFDISISYAVPKYESYGTDLRINSTLDQIFISDKRLLVSDNFGTDKGYSVQIFGKYRVTKNELLKAILNLGYTRLYSHHDAPQTEFGVKMQSFSTGLGIEIAPYSGFSVVPSIYGLLRLNMIGGESFHLAGLDFFKVTSRFGYSAGLKLAYPLSGYSSLFFNWNINYDNLWNKEENEVNPVDAHTIVFRDKASNTNGLSNDRRFAYNSFGLGMTIRLK